MTSTTLQARDLIKRYGTVVALDGVSLEVATGECVALVGESGSGKTTLLRCFNRLVEPDQGSILIGGQPASILNPVELRRHTGYVPQDGGLLPHWNVQRNAALVPWLLGQGDGIARAQHALELVGLAPGQFGLRWPHELSGGQRQRVAIARALAADPAVILMDEPFGALDAITRGEMHEVVLDLRRQVRLTIVLVTHDLMEAFHLADRIVVMRAGRVEQAGVPAELKTDPATAYVAHLLTRAGVL